jgi:hypothetical protein
MKHPVQEILSQNEQTLKGFAVLLAQTPLQLP